MIMQRARLFLEAYPYLEDSIALISEQYTPDDVFSYYMQGKCEMIRGEKSVMLLRIDESPRMRIAEIWLGGGDAEELLGPMRAKAEIWAARNGCKQVAFVGRHGWSRKKDDTGYESGGVFMWKEI